VHRLQKKAAKGENAHRSGQLRTLASILRATAYAAFGFVAFLQVLNLLGISTTSILASAGIIGIGIGMGAQSVFKDVINGIFIVLEDQYNVGEVVNISGTTGTVEDLSLRRTSIRDANGALFVIPNSQIATVSNLSRDFSVAVLQVSVDAGASPDDVVRLLRQVAGEVRQHEAFRQIATADPEVLGIVEIRGREIIYQINTRVRANQRDALLRELRRRVVVAFDKEGIPLGITSRMYVVPSSSGSAAPPAMSA